MKQLNKRLICVLLSLVMLFSLIPAAAAYTGVASWAQKEVAAMEELGLLPDSLLDADLSKPISRLDMSRIAVLAYESLTGSPIALPETHPFPDTTEPDIEKAWMVGIIKGDKAGTVRPYDRLTRVEFFVIASRFLEVLGYPFSEEELGDLSRFRDAASVPAWGLEATRRTVGLNIVRGAGDVLNWNASTARQEGILLFYRTYQVAAEYLNNSFPDESVPEDTEPEVTEPEVTEPEVTEPEVTEPEVTEPEVTEPEVTEPEVTEPEETEPEETEPEYDGDFINLSAWAAEAAYTMDELGLIPGNVKASSMTGAITRQDMCKILMRTYQHLTGISDEELNAEEHPFTDTDDQDVRNAYRLGIVGGKGNGIFAPNEFISRQDFFKMSVNFLNALGYPETDDPSVNLNKFKDAGQIAGYALGPTRLLVGLDIVRGNSDKTLKPRSHIVCQESLVIFYRIYNFVITGMEPGEPDQDPDISMGQEVVDLAMNYLGYPYVYAGKSPESGFDCSGFVYYVYKQFGYTLSPGATNQWNKLSDREVLTQDELVPGDLVFFSGNGAVSGMEHVGIYIGDGQFIHAANPRKGVIITPLSESYYAQRYLGGKRVIVD